MSPHRALLAAVVLLSSCHAPPASAPTQGAAPRAPKPAAGTPSKTASPAVPATRKPVGIDDDLLFERAEDADDVTAREAELVDLAKKSASSPARASVPVQRWDRKTAPKNLDRIVEHLGLTADEKKKLEANGFVALGRQEHNSYGTALHRVHEEELPLYVSADVVLQALFRSHESIMMSAESHASAELGDVLEKMRAELANAGYSAELAKDVDLYLTVADRLLRGEGAPAPSYADAAEVDALVTKATESKGVATVTMFGRPRLVDFSFYRPRGPYPRAGLSSYFQAMVWLTRLEMNVVTRGIQSSSPVKDTRETPREATLALGLADLAKRAGTMPTIAKLERLYRALSGPSEAIRPMDLERLGQGIALDDPEAAATKLRAAVGTGFRHTTNYHVRPFDTPELPAIATFLGVGITPDAPVIAKLMVKGDPRVVRGTDVAFALGVDRARAYAGADAQRLLAAARASIEARRGPDLYAAWLSAVRGLGATPKGVVASFVETPAFADTRVASAMIGYGQIRHAYALHGVQVYDEGGCHIPDAWVDPAVEVYEGILGYAKELRAMSSLLEDPARVQEYAATLETHVGALLAIAKDELAGRPLTVDQKNYLALVAENVPPSGYMGRSGPRFNGWYEHLFFYGSEGFAPAAFVADYATSAYNGRVSYLGAHAPVLGVFVVDAGGEPRAMVGPIGRALELTAPLTKRVSDEDDTSWVWATPVRAWETSYFAAATRTPKVSIREWSKTSVGVLAEEAIEVVAEAVDEHADVIARSAKVRLRPGSDAASIPLTAVDGMADHEHRDTRLRFPDGSVLRQWPNR